MSDVISDLQGLDMSTIFENFWDKLISFCLLMFEVYQWDP